MYIKKIIFSLFMTLIASVALTSCSEDDGIVEEFPDWQNRNETFFNNLTDSVQALIASGRTDWKRIRTWSKGEGDFLANYDYIIVHVIESAPATETASPLYTDSVAVHYKVNLLPSTSYPNGYKADASYLEPFDPDIAVPSKLYTGGSLIDGFTTALQYMRRGDYWMVYMPYQLSYGVTGSGEIPGYSTLIYEMRLKDFWSK
ncbi:MAG: FKBP-type peptidyl-prolyl cis-trans isomerase [Prevotella sp.]